MGQVKGQGLDTQRNPCDKAERSRRNGGVGLDHRQNRQRESAAALYLFQLDHCVGTEGAKAAGVDPGSTFALASNTS